MPVCSWAARSVSAQVRGWELCVHPFLSVQLRDSCHPASWMPLYLNSPFCWKAVSCRFLGFISKPLIWTSYKNREIAQETNWFFFLFSFQTENWRLFFQDKNVLWRFFQKMKSKRLGLVRGKKTNGFLCPKSHRRQTASRSKSASFYKLP